MKNIILTRCRHLFGRNLGGSIGVAQASELVRRHLLWKLAPHNVAALPIKRNPQILYYRLPYGIIRP